MKDCNVCKYLVSAKNAFNKYTEELGSDFVYKNDFERFKFECMEACHFCENNTNRK